MEVLPTVHCVAQIYPQAATQSQSSTCGGETQNPLLQWSLPALG